MEEQFPVPFLRNLQRKAKGGIEQTSMTQHKRSGGVAMQLAEEAGKADV